MKNTLLEAYVAVVGVFARTYHLIGPLNEASLAAKIFDNLIDESFYDIQRT